MNVKMCMDRSLITNTALFTKNKIKGFDGDFSRARVVIMMNIIRALIKALVRNIND